MEQQLQFIRQKCIEANPSIKDLVFGCEIVFNDYGFGVEKELNGFICWGDPEYSVEVVRPDGENVYTVTKDEIAEIIGREIRLADVLLAIEGTFGKTDKKGLMVTTMGEMWIGEIVNGAAYKAEESISVSWNLLKDSLSDQSPETISFIANLLK